MRCQCLVNFGAALEGSERPTPGVTGSEVLLRVVAAGVCHSDLHLREGGYDLGHGKTYSFRGMPLPLVLGHETVGVVEATGPDAGKLDPDRRYVVFPWQGCGTCAICATGAENLCLKTRFLGVNADGGYATHIKVPHPRYLFDIGDLAPEQAAPLACSGLTAFGALKKVEGTLRRQRLMIIGAGGLGLMCIGLVKALGGLAPIVVDIDPAKRAAAVAAGAIAAVDPKEPDARKQVFKLGDGVPPAAVIDFVGAEATAGFAFDAVARGGTIVMVGLFGGAAPWQLPLIPLKVVTIMGSYMGGLPEFAELMRLALAGAVQPLPITTYPLDGANTALDDLHAGRVVGRAVVMP
jgi:propanol-preferring alcohol dehydrogenase